MTKRKLAVVAFSVMIVAAACQGGGASPSSSAGGGTGEDYSDCTIAVSWNNFQQPRWAATDKPNIQKIVEDAGATYIDADANLVNEQQLTDIDTLISQGADVMLLLAQDGKAVLPGLQKLKDANIPVIAYDRLIEDPDVMYITFDNVGVGAAEAEAILAKVPEGNYVLIKGDPGDANASTFLPQGWDDAGLKAAVDSGKVKLLNGPDGTFTNGWKTETAQANMEAIIDKAVSDGTKIDAILAENDSTALGVAAALTGKSYGYPPLSGQDGDPANLQNVAAGIQYVDVWKNSNELGKAAGQAALDLCKGKAMADLAIPDGLVDPSVAPVAGLSAQDFTTPDGTVVKSFILQPTPIMQDNLQLVIDGGWITKEKLCEKAATGPAPAAICQ